MSKYIRTKDGRIIDCEDIKWKHPATYTEQAYIYAMTEKEADTIEELCDRFIIEYANNKHTIFWNFCDLKRHHELYNQNYHHITGRYGAIWTNKGLIYVAELNNDGKLELKCT